VSATITEASCTAVRDERHWAARITGEKNRVGRSAAEPSFGILVPEVAFTQGLRERQVVGTRAIRHSRRAAQIEASPANGRLA
jgi:hypothetical protein